MNWRLNIGLMCCLGFHYIGSEFDGTFITPLKPITRSKWFVYLFIKWQLFTEIQLLHVWLTMLITSSFLLAASMGLVLHFFTNMFSFTAITATILAGYNTAKQVTGKLSQVHLQVSHHQILMNTINDHLMTHLVEMRIFAAHKNDFGGQAQLMSSLEAADVDGDGTVNRTEFEEKIGEISDAEWNEIDENNSGTISIAEYETFKKHKLQKSVLLVRSAFQHSMSKSLQQAGFTQWKLVLAIFSLLGAISLIVGILVLLMKSANAFGAVSATVSSGISAIAIAVYNNLGAKKDKDDEGIDKRLQKSIDTINLKLDSFVGLAITDLVFMLRIFPRALDAIKSGIDEAEEKLISDAKDDEDVKAFLAGCIEQAKTAFEKARARCIEQV